jgi:hypothetical protein
VTDDTRTYTHQRPPLDDLPWAEWSQLIAETVHDGEGLLRLRLRWARDVERVTAAIETQLQGRGLSDDAFLTACRIVGLVRLHDLADALSQAPGE